MTNFAGNFQNSLDVRKALVTLGAAWGVVGKNGDKWPCRGRTLARSTKSSDWQSPKGSAKTSTNQTSTISTSLREPTNLSCCILQPALKDSPRKSPGNRPIASKSGTISDCSIPEPKESSW